jgi:Spy/CpxP family protein refolding chaperone
MNKMKKLIIAALLLVGVSNFAQEANTPNNNKDKGLKQMKSSEQRNEALLTKMTTDLNLDASQQAQVKPIIAEQSLKMEAMRTQQKANKVNNVVPTDADKKAMRKTRMDDKEATENKIKAMLTPDQFVKYQAMQEAEKAKMRESREKRQEE